MKEDFYSTQKQGDEIDLGTIFRFLLMQSKMIISIVTIAFIISYANYSLTTKEYKIQSLLQYESFNQNIFDPSNTLQMTSGNPSIDIMNLATLYESRTNILKVINDLKLNIKIEDLIDDEKVDISIHSLIDVNEMNQYKKNNLYMSFSNAGYSVLDSNNKILDTAIYGEYLYFDDLKILVKSANIPQDKIIEVEFRHPESMYNSMKSNISIESTTSVNSFFRNEGLMTVSMIDDNPELGKNIINYANKIFLDQRISVETEKSRKAIDFIDKNINSLEKVVESNKIKLKEFRERNKSIDVSLETQAIIENIQSLEQSLTAVDVEIAKAQEIYTENNPVYLNLLNKKKIIQKQKEDILSDIELMPKEQQEYIDLYNDVEVSQTLFEELETRRLGFSILEASTIGDIRVVDDAYFVSRVSPRISTIFLFTFLSMIFACILAIIRGYNYLPMTNPAELFDNNINIPILGVVPKIEDISLAKDDIRLNTSIESLIVNLDSMNNGDTDKNIITITSPSPVNGKSTLSMKLAEGYAKIGKKVLLVDNDLKRGNLAKNYNIKSINEKTFNAIDETNIENYLVEDNFYLIPRVKRLNNSFQFLYSHVYSEKIQFFKDYFDYVVFDTAPILSVADSSILIEKSDFNLLVVRHGINKINEVKQAIDNFSQINKNVDGILYNAYAKPKGYYGYYGMYGNYSYQYYAEKYLDESYEYKQD